MACAAPVDERAWFARAAAAAREASGAASACELRPLAFFVAWGGVLTLVYEGFPEPLVALKGALEASDLPLRKENFGSKWPKTTLGALADGVPALTLEQLASLRALCLEHGAPFQHDDAELDCRVAVRELAAVRYRRRGLEPPVEDRVAVPLGAAAPPDGTGASAPGAQAPPAEEAARVRGVLAEWDDLEAYLPLVNQPGSRIGSYRDGSPSGACLVAFLGAGPPLREGAPADGPPARAGAAAAAEPPGLLRRLAGFRAAVDARLDDASLHCTVRALDAAPAAGPAG